MMSPHRIYVGVNRHITSILTLIALLLPMFISTAHAAVNVNYIAKVTASALNVRSGPGSGYAIIGSRYKNQTVRVTRHVGSWRRIVGEPGTSSYVHGAYLRTNTRPKRTAASKDINVSDYHAFVIGSALNVRSGPSTTYGVIGIRYVNQNVRVTHHHGAWRRITWFGGRSAYVYGRYLRKRAVTPPSTPNTKTVDLTNLQQLERQKPGAAERYLSCMVGRWTSKGSIAKKTWIIFRNGVKQGLKKIATSPILAVHHFICLAAAHDWAKPPKPFSPQAETCSPTMGLMTGCKELDGFYGTPEGRKIWDAFQFTAACDQECKLTCYFHGKNKRTYRAFIDDPQTVARQCRYQ